MSNPFEEITQKLDSLIKQVEALQSKEANPTRIPLKDFCKQYNISRVTGYAWATRGLIQLEKVAGRQFVKSDSISVVKKFQREPIH